MFWISLSFSTWMPLAPKVSTIFMKLGSHLRVVAE